MNGQVTVEKMQSLKKRSMLTAVFNIVVLIGAIVLSPILKKHIVLPGAAVLSGVSWILLGQHFDRFQKQLQVLTGIVQTANIPKIGDEGETGSQAQASILNKDDEEQEHSGAWVELSSLAQAVYRLPQRIEIQQSRYDKRVRELGDSLSRKDESTKAALEDVFRLKAAGGQLEAEVQTLRNEVSRMNQAAEAAAGCLRGIEKAIDNVSANQSGGTTLLELWDSVHEEVSRLSSRLEKATSCIQEGVSIGVHGAGNTRDGITVVDALIHDMENIRERIDQTAGSVGLMQKHSGEIERIIHTIDEIADQTNLLALNAAIEAARAESQSLVIGETLLKDHLLGAAALLADMLVAKDGDVSDEDLKALAKRARVENVSFSNEDGVLVGSNLPEADLGFRYPDDESDFWYPLRALIHQKDGEVSFPIMPRSSDGKLYMYVAVSRRDQPGAVQAAASGEAVTRFARNTRGFGVVADEVRKLAEETLEATKEVRQQIRAVQKSVQAGAEAMDLSSDAVDSGARQVEVVHERFQEILQAVEDAGTLFSRLDDAGGSAAESAGMLENLCEAFSKSVSENVEMGIKLKRNVEELQEGCGRLGEILVDDVQR